MYILARVPTYWMTSLCLFDGDIPQLQEFMKNKYTKKVFVESDIIDDETDMFPTFKGLLEIFKRWGSCKK